jgi:hypothetical protein
MNSEGRIGVDRSFWDEVVCVIGNPLRARFGARVSVSNEELCLLENRFRTGAFESNSVADRGPTAVPEPAEPASPR